MELTKYDTPLRFAVIVALVAGVAAILVGDSLLAAGGILLIIFSVVSMLALVRNAMTDPETESV